MSSGVITRARAAEKKAEQKNAIDSPVVDEKKDDAMVVDQEGTPPNSEEQPTSTGSSEDVVMAEAECNLQSSTPTVSGQSQSTAASSSAQLGDNKADVSLTVQPVDPSKPRSLSDLAPKKAAATAPQKSVDPVSAPSGASSSTGAAETHYLVFLNDRFDLSNVGSLKKICQGPFYVVPKNESLLKQKGVVQFCEIQIDSGSAEGQPNEKAEGAANASSITAESQSSWVKKIASGVASFFGFRSSDRPSLPMLAELWKKGGAFYESLHSLVLESLGDEAKGNVDALCDELVAVLSGAVSAKKEDKNDSKRKKESELKESQIATLSKEKQLLDSLAKDWEQKYRASVVEKEGAINDLQRKLRASKEANSKAESLCGKLKKSNETLNAELAQAKKKIADLTEQNQSLQSEARRKEAEEKRRQEEERKKREALQSLCAFNVLQCSEDCEEILPFFQQRAKETKRELIFRKLDKQTFLASPGAKSPQMAILVLVNDTVRWSLPLIENMASFVKLRNEFSRVFMVVLRPAGMSNMAPESLQVIQAKLPDGTTTEATAAAQFTFSKGKFHFNGEFNIQSCDGFLDSLQQAAHELIERS